MLKAVNIVQKGFPEFPFNPTGSLDAFFSNGTTLNSIQYGCLLGCKSHLLSLLTLSMAMCRWCSPGKPCWFEKNEVEVAARQERCEGQGPLGAEWSWQTDVVQHMIIDVYDHHTQDSTYMFVRDDYRATSCLRCH